jgi:hypothetical protein
MRELRIQHQGRPYRVLYAFDPARNAILLLGGDKTGQDRWYKVYVPIADRLYDEHLQELADEQLFRRLSNERMCTSAHCVRTFEQWEASWKYGLNSQTAKF